jgi:hypothetical protein
MKFRSLLPAALLLASASASAQSDWTPAQVGLEVADIGLLAVDYRQTQKLRDFPGLWESNPLLSKHPSPSKVKSYFTTVSIGQAVLAEALNDNLRTGFLGGLAGLEIVVTDRNRQKEHQRAAKEGTVKPSRFYLMVSHTF